MNKNFNWKKKTAVFIGRFQPFHEGHKQIFLNALSKNKQVAILVMDSYLYVDKNPFKFNFVKIFLYDSILFFFKYVKNRFRLLTAFNKPIVECLSFLFFLKCSDKIFILLDNSPI